MWRYAVSRRRWLCGSNGGGVGGMVFWRRCVVAAGEFFRCEAAVAVARCVAAAAAFRCVAAVAAFMCVAAVAAFRCVAAVGLFSNQCYMCREKDYSSAEATYLGGVLCGI